jgi:hypothetical protein
MGGSLVTTGSIRLLSGVGQNRAFAQGYVLAVSGMAAFEARRSISGRLLVQIANGSSRKAHTFSPLLLMTATGNAAVGLDRPDWGHGSAGSSHRRVPICRMFARDRLDCDGPR